MFRTTPAFSGFAVDDVAAARAFYGETLGLEVTELGEMGLLQLTLGGGAAVLVYPKPEHTPATFTILNFPVQDIDGTVAALAAAGVAFERYPELGEPGDNGVYRGPEGPPIAWFLDPAGNVLSVLEDAGPYA
jgi:catechol 2,3-dioxygenase-like lactoylglutathione lyase family enzyme